MTAPAPARCPLDQAAYTAHENQGYLTITIQRTGDLSGEEHVGYGVKRQDAQPGIDFDTIPNHYITFAPGQDTYTFNVRIIDQGMNATPVRALAYLYSSWPDSLGANNNSPITILHDDPVVVRDPTNPLAVPAVAGNNPLAGAKFYVDPNSGAAKAQAQYRHSNPAMSALLGDIAAEPGAHRFYMWNMGSNVSGQVSHYLEGTQVQEPGTTVMLSTYTLVHDHCGYTATPAIAARYEDFMHQVAEGIGNYHVVFFLELDSLITAPCLTHSQLAIREAELKSAVSALEADPHVVVYLDAGAADAVKYRQMARVAARLRGRPGPGLLPELHALRLDQLRDPLRPADLPAAGRRALRRQHRRERQGPARAQAARRARQRGALQPARPWPGPAVGVRRHRPADRLRRDRRPALVLQPGRKRRPVPPRRPAHRRLLARVRGDARPQLGRQGRRAEGQPPRVTVRGGAPAQVATMATFLPPEERARRCALPRSCMTDSRTRWRSTTTPPSRSPASPNSASHTPSALLRDPPLDRGAAFALSDATVRPLVPRPGKIICVGLNYKAHIEETHRDDSDYPVLFTKFATSLTGAYDTIACPPESSAIDYEGELAVVIGTRTRRADPTRALDAVAGYTVANDVTMRDFQYRTHQWLQGKAWDASTPLGPALVTPGDGP